jgi:hypothetical protein
MKKLLIAACFTVAALAPVLAGAETAQQQKMKDCNTQASAQKLSGAARQQFMSTCLKGGGGTQLTAQQQKMKDCNAQATQQKLTGKERKAFMSNCLSGKPAM